MTWQDTFCLILCAIYEAWGGDCDDLGCDADENAAAATVIDQYDNAGPPDLTPTAKQKLLTDLDSLEAHLTLPGNSLSASVHAALTQMINDLRSDLDGPTP